MSAKDVQDTAGVDDSVRRLLDPKSFQKGKGKGKEAANRGHANVTSSRSSSVSNQPGIVHNSFPNNTSSPVLNGLSNAPRNYYDAKALLNPKTTKLRGNQHNQPSPPHPTSLASRKMEHVQSFGTSNQPISDGGVDSSTDGSEPGGRKNLFDRHFGVESRAEQPRKKIKVTADDKDGPKGKHTFNIQSNGIVGDYMKPKPDSVQQAWSTAVDLTEDAADDEITITGSREILNDRDVNEQEVCFGSVVATTLAYLVPKPKTLTRFTSDADWPAMKCTLSRNVQSRDDTIIDVIDPCGKPFGRISPELAVALAPLMDGLPKLRAQARLLSRRKKPSDWHHQPCSDQLKMFVNIYGRRSDAERLGKRFGQNNIWLRQPIAPDVGIPTCNPHASKNDIISHNRDTSRRSVMNETRTTEEAAQEVSKLFDHFAKDAIPLPSTEPPPEILTPLLEHQKQALTFLLQRERTREYGKEEAENTSLWRLRHHHSGRKTYHEVVSGLTLNEEPDQVYGGLLADVMGLGKTLEALTLIVSTKNEAIEFGQQKLVRAGPDDAILLSHTRATLLIVPLSTIKNWEDQVNDHVKPGFLKVYVYHGNNRVENPHLLADHDIVITTYGTIAAEFSNKHSRQDSSPVRRLKWFRIVLDEAHTIRESRSAQSQAIYSLWAQRRWCLTGTPIQNRIDDLGSLTRFLRLFPYDTAARFNQYIRSPAGGSDPSFLKSLRVFVDSFTLRRLRDRIDLPNRQDLTVILPLSAEEQKMHDFFKDLSHVQITETAMQKKPRSNVQHQVLQGIMTLRLICAHGKELLKEKDLARLKGISADEAIDLDEIQEAPTLTKHAALEAYSLMAEASVDLCRQCDKKLSGDSPGVESEDSRAGIRCHVLPCLDVLCDDCFAPYKAPFDSRPDKAMVTCPFCSMVIGSQYVSITSLAAEELERAPEDSVASEADSAKSTYYGGPHTKTIALLGDISEMEEASKTLIAKGEPPIKCVVFSEFTSHLDLIGRALTDTKRTFVRIDGTMTLNKRKKVLDALGSDNSVTILLASIKAAGQGLNLTACSRAFIMEPMWNPAAEAQAVDRIYRIGQKREVVVKRYQMKDSIEIKIVELQRKKQALADVSMNRNHKALSKQEVREQHFRDIKALFS